MKLFLDRTTPLGHFANKQANTKAFDPELAEQAGIEYCKLLGAPRHSAMQLVRRSVVARAKGTCAAMPPRQPQRAPQVERVLFARERGTQLVACPYVPHEFACFPITFETLPQYGPGAVLAYSRGAAVIRDAYRRAPCSAHLIS